MAVKSCNRLFDSPCGPCDEHSADEARNKWAKRVAGDYTYGNSKCGFYLERLKRHVRELSGGWGRGLERCRKDVREPFLPHDVYVPDQQGCREAKRGEGGTLSVDRRLRTSDYSLVRRGVAKQKGKYRVVTMQSAYVKRSLRPVHNALYDHLSSFSWCVRGDVQAADFEAVAGSSDEEIISGDFDSATDLILLPAVEAIVETLAEDVFLSEEERVVLLGSFKNLRWVSCSGVIRPILRGSMMGNLVSFPLLCLLNKACHDIAAEEVYGSARRVGRFNGDDCLFAGSRSMYDKWRTVTSIFGLVVNETKTMRSRHFADLNSQRYDLRRRNLVSKPCLSFLRVDRYQPGEILTSVLRGIKSFRPDVQQWIVSVKMRYEISLRGFSLSNIPSGWVRVLVRKKWFRRCVMDGPALVHERVACRSSAPLERPSLESYDRSFPTTMGPPPRECFHEGILELCSRIQSEFVSAWEGVRVTPPEPRLNRRDFRDKYQLAPPTSFPRFVGVSVRWAFLWPTPLLECVRECYPSLLLSDRECLVTKSLYDSPLLTLSSSYRIVRAPRQRFPNPFVLPETSPRWSPFFSSHLVQCF